MQTNSTMNAKVYKDEITAEVPIPNDINNTEELLNPATHSADMKTSTPEFIRPQYLAFMLMLYITFTLTGCASLYKLVQIGPLVGPGGLYSLPFVLLLEDIIAEVYGYKISRTLLWYIMFAQLIFTFFMVGVINLPSPTFWHDQTSYQVVFGRLLEGSPIMVFAIMSGKFLNLYAITKTKILVNGRYFWLRSILCTLVGSLVTLGILYPLAFNNLTFDELSTLFLSDLFIRFFYSVIGAAPAAFVVVWLKKREKLDVYDYGTNFNPFKLSIQK